MRIGVVESIELNSKPKQSARTVDGGVALKISGDNSIMFGRHFDETN